MQLIPVPHLGETNLCSSQVSQANLSNSLTSQYPPDPGEHVLKKSGTEIGEQDFPVKWFKFISKPRMTETSTLTPLHVAYSPIALMNHQWTINLHDGYPLSMFCHQQSTSHPPFPTICNLKFTMFYFGVDLLYSTTEPQHDLPSLAPPKGEMVSSFSWTSFFQNPTSSTLCFGDSTLAKCNQVKLSFCITKLFCLVHPTVYCCRHYFLCSKIFFLHTPSF